MSVEKGCSLSQACAALGIQRTTVFRWRASGAQEIDRRTEGLEPRPEFELHAELVRRIALAEEARVPRLVEKAQELAFERRKETSIHVREVRCGSCGNRATERTATETTKGPDGYMIRWLLGHLGGPQWQHRQLVDVRFDPADLMVDFHAVLDAMESFIAGRANAELADEMRRLAARLLRERAARTKEAMSA